MKNALSKNKITNTVLVPLKITLAYLIVGGLWILLSDKVLELFATDPKVLTQIAIIKGWFYVAATGLMLYALISRGASQIRRSEQEARITESKYRELVESANSIIMRRDVSGHITFFNGFAEDFFGYTKEEILGRNVVGTIVPEVDRSGRNLKAMIEDIGKHPERYANNENENIRRNGEPVWIAWTNKPIRDEHGKIVEVLCIGNDITERKRAEEVLRRFELLVAHSRDIIFFIQRDDGRILEANEAATKAYGYSREQLLAMTIHQLRAPETLELIPDQMAEADMHGILLETVHRRSDGSTFPVEVSSRGETIGGTRTLISVVRDITERKRAEEALRISEERFRKLFEESPIGIAFLGKQREIFLTNQRYRDFLGYSEAEIIERGPVGLLHPDDWEPSMALSTKLRAGEIPLFHMEQRYIRKDGTVVWADTQITVLRDKDGRLVHTIGWVQDITNRKRVEEELHRENQFRSAIVERASEGLCVSHGVPEYPYVQFTVWNPRMTDITGYTMEEINRLGWYQSLYPDPEVQTRAHARMDHLRQGTDLLGEEWEITNATGEKRVVSISTSVLQATGDSTHLLALIHDITERKRAEEAIARERIFSDDIINSLPGIFYMYDDKGKLVRWNRKHEEATGYSSEELLGMHVLDLFSEEHKQYILSRVQSVFAEGEAFAEAPLLIKDGNQIPYFFTGRLTALDGQQYLLGVGIDITERKRAEEEKDAAPGATAAGPEDGVGGAAGRRRGPRFQQHAFSDPWPCGTGDDAVHPIGADPCRSQGDREGRPPFRRPHPATAGLCPQADRGAQGPGFKRHRGGHAQDAAAADRRGH